MSAARRTCTRECKPDPDQRGRLGRNPTKSDEICPSRACARIGGQNRNRRVSRGRNDDWRCRLLPVFDSMAALAATAPRGSLLQIHDLVWASWHIPVAPSWPSANGRKPVHSSGWRAGMRCDQLITCGREQRRFRPTSRKHGCARGLYRSTHATHRHRMACAARPSARECRCARLPSRR